MKPSKCHSQMAPHTLKHHHFNTIPATIMIVGVWKKVGRGRLTSKKVGAGKWVSGRWILKIGGRLAPKTGERWDDGKPIQVGG